LVKGYDGSVCFDMLLFTYELSRHVDRNGMGGGVRKGGGGRRGGLKEGAVIWEWDMGEREKAELSGILPSESTIH